MKEKFLEIPLNKNEQNTRFELHVDGYMAFIDYREFSTKIALIHTHADPELAGSGAAAALVEKTLVWVKQSGLKLLPYCPYVFAYLRKHPEWIDIVDKKFEKYAELVA